MLQWSKNILIDMEMREQCIKYKTQLYSMSGWEVELQEKGGNLSSSLNWFA